MAENAINPQMLDWAMRDASFDLPDLADATGRPQDLVEGWLSGEAKPQTGDLRKMAKLLGRSIHFFFLPEPPSAARPAAEFRAAISGEATTPSQEILEVRFARNVQKIATWSAAESRFGRHQLPTPSKDFRLLAREFRATLNWSVQDQRDAAKTSKTAVFRSLRQKVENLGVVVLLRNAGKGNCRGFSLPDGSVPVIYINAAYDLPTLRTYTLLHEMAHVIRGDKEICHESDTPLERWCDKFAAAVLLPEDDLRAYLSTKNFRDLDSNLDAVRLISNRYGSSWSAVSIRLKELGLATQRLADLVETSRGEFLEKKSNFSTVPQTVSRKRAAEFGYTYPRLILDALDNRRLSALDASKYLRAPGPELHNISVHIGRSA
jgi:Zn-dependent peptidase ImmA (M78 family)